MPDMVPPDYGSNMKDSYWLNPDPGFEPVSPHEAPLNRYQTRKTQRKENIYGYTGGGDATPWEPVNYAGYRHYPCYYLSFPPEIASEPESSHHSDQGVVRKDTAIYGGRLRPPTLTDDPGLDILEGTDSNGKSTGTRTGPRRRASIATGRRNPLRGGPTTRDPGRTGGTTTALRPIRPTTGPGRRGARAGGIGSSGAASTRSAAATSGRTGARPRRRGRPSSRPCRAARNL